MASADTFLPFKNASTNLAGAIEKLLEQAAECADMDRTTSMPRSPQYFDAQQEINQVWKKCFELGAISIKLAHEIIAFFSEPDKLNVSEIHSQYRSVVLAIEAARIRSAELQLSVETAWKARRSLVLSGGRSSRGFIDASMDIIDEYFGAIEDGKMPSFETRATELARLWSSLNPKEVEITPFTPDIIVRYQQHIIRVCLYWLPLRQRYETAGSAVLDSPLMDHLFKEHILGKEDSVRVLARYSTLGTWWASDALTRLLGKEVISALSYLQSSDLGDLLPEISSSLPKLLQLFAKTFASLLSAFSSTWAAEQCVHKLKILDIFPLDKDPFAVLQTVLAHQGCVREAILNAHTHVDAVKHLLKQFPKNPSVIGRNDSANSNDNPECVDCMLGNLLAYSEEVLLEEILHPYGWKWATSEAPFDKSKNVIIDFRNIFISDRLYTPSLHPEHFADPDPDPSTISQIPPSPIDLSFDPENLQLFWPRLLAIMTNLRKHLPLPETRPSHSPRRAPPKPTFRWRPCTCKEQRKFAAESKEVKELSKTTAPGTLGPLPKKISAPTSSAQGRSSAQKQGGIRSLQGDWTF